MRESEEAISVLLTAIKIRISHLPENEINETFKLWLDSCADAYGHGAKVNLANPEPGYARELKNLHTCFK
jgi:hypothetical protein